MHDLAFCALCLWMVTEPDGCPVELLDSAGNRMTFRTEGGSVRLTPTVEEVLEHAQRRPQPGHGEVRLSDGTLLPMLADTYVRGTLVCAQHVTAALTLEGLADVRRPR